MRERPVLDVQRRGEDLAEELLPHQPRHEDEHPDGRDQQHDVRRGEQPAQPPGPEPVRLTEPVRSTSRRMCEVIRYPEMTKKTSTPM